jgi:hypothetical protein
VPMIVAEREECLDRVTKKTSMMLLRAIALGVLFNNNE